LSYPLGPRGWLTAFHTRTYATKLSELLKNPAANVLVVFGDQDEFTSNRSYDSWVQGLVKDAGENAVLTTEKIPGGSHFWIGEPATAMGRAVQRWLP
jgi:uncharacterized protein